MLQDIAATRSKLQELRDAGIGVSIDDFGTGYSSLSYLQQFPVTTLKIARDFVDVDSLDSDAWELASAIVALGRTLRLSVIAEAWNSGPSSAACGRWAASSHRASARGR